jgi:hypothetical protein
MGVTLAVIAEEVVEAFLQRTARGIEHSHAPLADCGRRVALRFQELPKAIRATAR